MIVMTRIAAAAAAIVIASASATAAGPNAADLSAQAQRLAARAGAQTLAWYERTPPAERMTWGGLAACAALGVCVTLERLLRLRRRAVVPRDFLSKFLDRLHEGKLDGGKALDYCEMHPSPAARVALAAVRRWGRPAVDMERAVGLAHRWESDRLRRNVGTLRRIAVLAPLLGLLGALLAADRLLRFSGDAPVTGPATADALAPLIAGAALGVAALVLYDLLATRVERLGATLDRIGAETIDAVAMTTKAHAPTLTVAPPPAPSPQPIAPSYPSTPHIRIGDASSPRRPIMVIPVRESAPRKLRDDSSAGA
ncbi:MotA/TolQ/ExbB proton channel family protein [Paludisphaera rhizosphaerae]|uniref:MotA/TolQ/ExbB proton channel family protein n=1 Tax=Paludisphaera rhizosphaerae TaxID=2711216 RepID=UPI0013EC1789|nr:MotA/TolQ/ExbB proton channel family protein [Paludisphaera rhizosphaerae]